MTNPLNELIAEKGVLLADGATGTTLFGMGLEAGAAPELWNVDKPENIRQLHQGFIDAGSDIILTNSFGGTRHRLKLHNAQDRVHELNKHAGLVARDVAEAADRKVIVAGSVGPTGELLAPLGSLTIDECVESFKEQMAGLKEGTVDVLWIETMSSVEEIQAAAKAAEAVGLPYVVTASFDTAGRTMMGLLPGDIHTVVSEGEKPVALGANCGVGASDLLASVLEMTKAEPEAIIVAKANCGIPQVSGDEVIYTGTPELMYDYTHLAMDAGAKIVGGCCGTSCVHLAEMRKAIDDYKPGDRPDIDTIEQKIGPLVNRPAAANDAGSQRTRRGGRRRA
ncbi:MAG: betaine--homocysteine S-methyltransferase [Rhizobiaceae bacterium]|nr:betaine--homocysteine S-methyltransferase [Rhizobiaceae bacterium]